LEKHSNLFDYLKRRPDADENAEEEMDLRKENDNEI